MRRRWGRRCQGAGAGGELRRRDKTRDARRPFPADQRHCRLGGQAAADVRDARDLPGRRRARSTPILGRPGVTGRPVPARRVLPRQRGLDAGSLRTALQRLGRRRIRDRSTQLSAFQHLTAGSERRCREPARRHQLPHLGDDPVGCRPDEPVRRRGRRRADCRRRPLSVRRRRWGSVSTGAASTGGSTPVS